MKRKNENKVLSVGWAMVILSFCHFATVSRGVSDVNVHWEKRSLLFKLHIFYNSPCHILSIVSLFLKYGQNYHS